MIKTKKRTRTRKIAWIMKMKTTWAGLCCMQHDERIIMTIYTGTGVAPLSTSSQDRNTNRVFFFHGVGRVL